MKVLLVRPRPSSETIGLQHVMLVEPLELEIIAALCRPHAEPVVVDMTLEDAAIEEFLERENPDVLAVGGYITNVPEMIAYCRAAKRKNPRIVTVAGGVHCEVCPQDLDDPAVDFRLVRNAVTAFPLLLAHARGEGPLPPGVFTPGVAVDPKNLPRFDFAYVAPDRTTTRKYRDRYFYIFHDKVALLKTAFGCPYKCSFCFCRKITTGLYRERPMPDVLDELERIEETEIYIVDDDFLVSVPRMRAFLAGIRERNIHKRYLVYGRADFIAKHPELMAELKRAGLSTVIVGFESFLEGELDGFHKETTVEINKKAMHTLNRLGIDCFATLIMSPTWSRKEFDLTAKTLVELGIRFVNLQPLTPLPGTGFEVPKDQLMISRSDFARWDLAHVMVRPTQMTVPDYYREIIRLYMRVLFRPRVLFSHLRYSFRMIGKMLAGSYRVRQQYLHKITEAQQCRSSS